MSLIRKPDIEVFRDSSTVTALRGAKVLAQEGGGGAARAVGSLWLSMMLVAFIMSGLGAMVQARSALAAAVCIPLVGAAVWALFRIWREPTRERAVEDGADPVTADISVPLPDHLRGQVRAARPVEGFHVKYWPKAFVNQATFLLIFGAMGLSLTLRHPGFLTGLALLTVLRGVLLLSIFFRGGVCVTASPDRLSVRSLISKSEILWDDIVDIRTETFSRRDYWVMLATGARHHIVVSGYHRFGSGKLLIPYKLLGLDEDGRRDLIRRLLMKKELARSAPQISRSGGAGFGNRHVGAVAAEPQTSFDPDAIIRRYMAERDQPVRDRGPVFGRAEGCNRSPVREHVHGDRPVRGFGRKRTG